MPRTHLRSLATALAVAFVSITDPGAAAAAPTSTCTLAAAGDVAGANDWKTGAESTAKLIEGERPEAVLALGDLAYYAGTKKEFATYYDPTWGRFKDITYPTPGNHEYYTAAQGNKGHDAKAYFDYFDVEQQYSVDLCGWHVVSLDSEVDPATQIAFLREDVAAHPDLPLLVFWHTPRFSSGPHGNNSDQQALWEAAEEAGARVVLSAHDHLYERFAPMDADGERDPAGARLFVSGGGGHNPKQPRKTLAANSEKVVTGPSVLFLDLRPDGYDWRNQSPDGRTQDEGTSNF